MKTLRAGITALVLLTTASLLVACTQDPDATDQPTSSVSSTDPSAAAPTAGPSAEPTTTAPTAAPTASASAKPTAKPQPTRSDQPVPKVGRPGSPDSPTVSAKPAGTDGTVRYGDGVSLTVKSVDFAEETKKGPGSFPGRAYAVLTLQIANKSKQNLSLDTVVVTVLDKAGKPVAPVYSNEAEVADFAGRLTAGKTVEARYAFAVPKTSRSKVTVVVDFDGVHTSAVFRGELD
jgi:hypothetical protein